VVQQWHKTWRLRYAAIDVEDRYGGSVTLVGPPCEQLKDGQRIRVTGQILNREERVAPQFQVQTIEVVDQ
jgi:hypothetical protein